MKSTGLDLLAICVQQNFVPLLSVKVKYRAHVGFYNMTCPRRRKHEHDEGGPKIVLLTNGGREALDAQGIVLGPR